MQTVEELEERILIQLKIIIALQTQVIELNARLTQMILQQDIDNYTVALAEEYLKERNENVQIIITPSAD